MMRDRPPPPLPQNLFIATHFVRISAALIAIIAIIRAVICFIGFPENDRGFMHLLSAFMMCFSLGIIYAAAFVYAAVAAHSCLKRDYEEKNVLGGVLTFLFLPWLIASFQILRGEIAYTLWGIALFGLCIAYIFWGYWVSKVVRRLTRYEPGENDDLPEDPDGD